MIFNSYLFVLCFLPFVVILYHILNHARKYFLAKTALIGASLLFIGYGGRHSLCFLLVSAASTWAMGRGVLKWKHSDVGAKVILGLAVCLQIVVLGYYKYAYFFIQNVNDYAHTSFSVGKVLVPAGISFITFQQIAFLMDLYRGKIQSAAWWDYVFYISYFPKLIQGPIARYDDMVSQMNDVKNKKANMENLSHGLWLFATGLARKALVADVLSRASTWGFGPAMGAMTAMDALIVSFCFTFQIYFDFSGYSRMALGVSKMLNLNLPDNFDAPYRSISVAEFWKRWHISLTSFLREYLYFPLGGNRKGKARTLLNTMIVFLASGLWHGAAWNYVFWGGLHGVALCLDKICGKILERIPAVVRWALTFLFVNTAWIFFRAESVSQAWEMLQKILTMQDATVSQELLACFELPEIVFLAGKFPVLEALLSAYPPLAMIVFLAFVALLCLCIRDRAVEFRPSLAKCIITVCLFSWSVVSFSTVVEFIYGNF